MTIDDLSYLFKALSDTTRLKILKILEGGELCVCDIIAALDIVQPKASFHLKVLKSVGLIKDRKVGKWIHYRINDMDIFKRFIVLSVIQQIDNTEMQDCRQRLEDFITNKPKPFDKQSCGCRRI
ncbi:MAG: metalloregulator ArsR/SmtB family transcription factor [Thermodesulfovibrionales bacterium]|nr:metalloregulator ArsR/SmtB family transcription factor [Thermodesulfovibrionales bacterium]